MAYYEGEINPGTAGGCNSGFFGGNGWGDLAALIVVAGLFGGFGNWGFGGNRGNSSVQDNYILATDFANIERKIDVVNNGICDGFYAMNTGMLNGFGTINTGIMQNGFETRNAIQGVSSQLADCCCKTQTAIQNVNYNMAMNANTLQNAMCLNTRDIIESQNANYRALHDELVANKLEAKNDLLAQKDAQIAALQLKASQEAQNNYLISAIRPCPQPSYIVPNPFGYSQYNSCASIQ